MSSAPFQRKPEPDAVPGWLLGAWLVTGIALAAVAALAIRREDHAARADWQSRLSRAADDRLALADRALQQWHEEVHLIGRLESVHSLLTRRSDGRRPELPDAGLIVRGALDEAALMEPGAVVSVADRDGNVVLSTTSAALAPEALEPAREAMRGHRTLVSRLAAAGTDALTLEFAEPVVEASGEAAGAVVLVVDARRALTDLFPRPGSSAPERLFIVVPEADRYLVVAPSGPDEAGEAYRLPVSDRATFAAAAFAAPRAVGEFSDGRGHIVFAATRRIPGIGWALVVEVDRGAAMAASHRRILWILCGAAGLFAAFVGIGHAWRRALKARHYREISQRDSRYRVLLEQTQEAVAVSVNGRIAYANPACVEMFGYQKPLLGVPVTIFFAPGSREQIEEIVQHRAAGRPAPELYEAVGLRGDGTTFAVELRVTPVEFEDQVGSQAILRDITGRKRMEAEIRESEERYRLLFERNLAGVYRSTPDGRLLECNRAFAQMMGYASPAEAMAQPGTAFHANHETREKFLERLRGEGSLVNYENQARRKDGSLIWIVENVSLLGSEDDGEEILLGTVFDMTDRRRLEEQLLQSQKMEAVGRLAGGIAHDFNNLLTAVAGYSELLLRELPEGDPLRESAEEIRQAGNRAAALTQQLLAFSRRQVLEPRVLDLNAVITGMERMLRRVIGEDVELMTALDPELWRARADPGQIEQAILNLVVNARDAMPRGGRLTLETANVELDEKFAGHYATIHPGPHVMLAVSDTGVGMDADLQARLFEPFFTTKEHGKGTGLGLSTTYGIVKQSGGSIWVYSEPGHGTTFKIYLPRCEEPLEDRAVPPPAREAAPGTETVLLVEDEPEVRRLVEKLLRLKGYRVLSAASPAEAVTISKRHEAAIELLLTDVIMPGMNGRELSRVLAANRPRMRVLYMSGYTDAAMSQQGILPPGTAFLSKPFTPEALSRKVRDVLDNPPENLKSS
jgi:two-component system cell cycle sensor histidine kinase/response regulator CckA